MDAELFCFEHHRRGDDAGILFAGVISLCAGILPDDVLVIADQKNDRSFIGVGEFRGFPKRVFALKNIDLLWLKVASGWGNSSGLKDFRKLLFLDWMRFLEATLGVSCFC